MARADRVCPHCAGRSVADELYAILKHFLKANTHANTKIYRLRTFWEILGVPPEALAADVTVATPAACIIKAKWTINYLETILLPPQQQFCQNFGS